jgi:hypothetical protein
MQKPQRFLCAQTPGHRFAGFQEFDDFAKMKHLQNQVHKKH